MIQRTVYKQLTFGEEYPLSNEDRDVILSAIKNPGEGNGRILGGRGVITEATLNDGRTVIVKHFRRGGILRRLIDRYYIGLGTRRPEVEFKLLTDFRKVGGSAPEPIAFVTKGSLVYQGWLVTKKIPGDSSLADISVQDVSRATNVLKDVVQQIGLLIEHKIFHIDLHPGNVLVDDDDVIYLIDFDKAHRVHLTGNALRDKYLLRWRRAVIKHNLPDFLSELMCGKLLMDFDGTGARKFYDEEQV